MPKLRLSPEAAFAAAQQRIKECRAKHAVELHLGNLGLTEIPGEIEELTWITTLRLHENELSELPEVFDRFPRLQELVLRDNRLTRIPNSIGTLHGLRVLDLGRNQLHELPETMEMLRSLEYLSLIDNRIWDLPSLNDLPKLTDLSLAKNKLGRVPEAVFSLRNLDSLFLYQNHLREVPDHFEGLSRLRELDLSRNRLSDLPPSLCSLPRLEILALGRNRFEELPERIANLKRLRRLFLHENRLEIPDEVLGVARYDIPISNDDYAHPGDILSYYFRTRGRGAAQPLNEFKLILVGRGGVGKTSLVHRLTEGEYKEFKRTPGIKITRWPLKIDGDDVQAHVWDFGGQEIMHGTHRFFMTERALYLVLISPRENTEDHDAEYWLSLVRSFAGDDAPVIVLLHKWDDAHFELNRELLREKYGRGLVFLETDSETGHGIKELETRIRELAGAMPGLKAKWPSDWRRVKEELPAAKKNWLAFEEFCAFCHERGVEKREDQEALAESLHALGLMLAYRKEEALRGFGVLNPQWVTKGIYDLLNSTALKAQNGKLTCGDFAKLLPARNYPAALHPYLLALMRKFRLCFPLDDDGRAYLIPELLTKEEPKLDAEFPPEKCLGFIYRYESVLPEGLLPRFIVETYVHREPKHAWRTGVVLERANCRALVRGDVLGRTVTIRVTGTGNGQRELLGIIREYFERIHRSFEKLPVTELVPVPGNAEFLIPYKELIEYEALGDDEYKVVMRNWDFDVFTKSRMVKLSVKKLLDGVDVPGVPRGKRPRAVEFLGPVGRLSLFISYSHKDDRFRDELRGALTADERAGKLTLWDDTRIEPGQKWEPEILGKLEGADIIVMLLSNDFIRSDYCMQKEWEIARERDDAGECAIVPIVVRACPCTKLDVGQIQAIQPGGKPIKAHRDRDAAWLEVTKQLDRVIARLKKKRGL